MHNDEGDTMQTGTAPHLACWYVKVSADTLVPMPSEKVYRESVRTEVRPKKS